MIRNLPNWHSIRQNLLHVYELLHGRWLLLFFLSPFMQSVAQISGTVRSDDNEAMLGVSVLIKGTTRGTNTDVDGKFTANAKPGDVLIFSFIGYLNKELTLGNETILNISMASDVSSLEEVVVVGYGTQKKSQLTGAISTVKAKDIAALPIENTQQALQGRVAGVDVMQAGSRPGTQPRVIIRGRRSFNASNDPLYVLDGIPLVSGIGDFSPNDIASMEVLKDASATAIYGARGANGVVLITSRRGNANKPQVFYNTYYGVSKAHDIIHFMNGEQFAAYKREAYSVTGAIDDNKIFSKVELENIAQGRSTDYISKMLRPGLRSSHNIGLTGGNDRSQLYLSYNYYKDNGVIRNMDYTRNVLRVNLDHKVSKNVKFGLSSFFNYSTRNGESYNPLGGAMAENPLGKPYNDDGTLNFLPTEDGLRTNPLNEIVKGAIINERKTYRYFAGLYGEWSIAKGLKYRVNFAPDFRFEELNNFMGSLTTARRLAPPTAAKLTGISLNYTIENILNYDKSFGAHTLNLTGVQSLQQDRRTLLNANVTGVPSENQKFHNIGQASQIDGVNSDLSEWSILSYMGRVNYGFADKYLLTATLRADGASRFGENTKWGLFPGIALAWNLSNEKFIENIPAIDLMKLRVSYGAIGNQAINPYQTQGLLTRTAYNWIDNPAFGYAPNTIGNPDLHWESSTTANIGLDFSLFRGRISGTFEVYQTNTSDLLLAKQLPSSIGFTQVTTNVGKTRNSGFEATISSINIDNRKNFKWSTDFTFFTNREQILALSKGKVDEVGNSWFIGQPLSVIYDFKKVGIWQSNEADLAAQYQSKPGEIRIADINNDGKFNSDDRVIHGSGVPKFSAGLTNHIEFAGFDFSTFLYARIGQKIRSNFHSDNNTLFGRYNNIVVDYWTPNNPTNAFPRPNQNQERPKWNSSLVIFDGSFVKIRNINLGYNFKQKISKKLGMSKLRIYTSLQQPFIFSPFISKYSGTDPETDIDAGLNSNVSPAAWTATLGLDVEF